MALATLSIDLEARLAKLDEGMNKAARLTEKQSARMDAALNKSREVALSLGAAFGGALSVAGIARFVKANTDAIDALNDVKDSTGATIENISALEDIARRSGGTLDDVSGVLIKFNAILSSADGKNGASKALDAIGLSAAELKKLDPAEALRQTAVALSAFADDGNKARLVQELFGKSVKEAAPFLKDLAEVGKLNATVTTAQADAAERFNKQIFGLEADLAKMSKTIVSSVLPAIQGLISELNDGAEAYGNFWDATKDIGLNVDPFKSLNQNLTSTVVRIREARDELASARKNSSMAGLSGLLAGNDVKRLEQELSLLEKREVYLRKQQSKQGGRGATGNAGGYTTPEGQTVGPVKPPLSVITTTSATAARVARDDAAKSYLESLQRQLDKTEQLTMLQEAESRLIGDLAGKFTAAQEAKVKSLASEIDQKKALADVDRYLVDLLNEKAEANRAAIEAADRWFESAMTPNERLAISLKEINALYEKGAFKADEWGTAEQKRDRVIQKAINSTNELSDSAKNYAQTMLEAVQRGDDLGKALEQIAMKAFIFDPLSKAIDGLFSGAGNPAAAGASAGGFNPLNLVGSLISTVFGGFFADGGDPPVGKVSVVGERGPELFMPKSAGTIIPNGGFGQSVVINQQISIGEGVSANGVMAAMVQTKAATVAEVMQVLRGRGVPV